MNRTTGSRLSITAKRFAVMLACCLACASPGIGGETNAPAGMVQIPAGVHRPLFRSEFEPREVAVKSFYLDVLPVTNADFLEFVRANPQWQRSHVKRLFADEAYLKHWAGDLELGTDAHLARQPVTNVSWFAAKAYAVWKKKRLPTTTEWEYAAGAGFDRVDGAKDPYFVQALNQWYATPAPETLPPVGSTRKNYFGVYNLHGLIWEWTSDFNSSLVTGDARGDTGLERQLFCAAGSLDATDRANFPAFMRFGFRSSLKASYTVHNLGFRCAKNL